MLQFDKAVIPGEPNPVSSTGQAPYRVQGRLVERDPWFDRPFDRPFDRLTVLSEVEGLTVLSKVEGLTTLSKAEGESRKIV